LDSFLPRRSIGLAAGWHKPSAIKPNSFGRSFPSSGWTFLLAFAGAGIAPRLPRPLKAGLKPFLIGAIGEVAIGGFMLGLVLAAQRIS
jgi:hypothetical protein